MAVFIKKVNIPQKSDLINIDMTGSGTAQTYRIIKKISDDVVEVLGMSDASSIAFDSNSTNTYAGKTLDTYLNSTWYNTLSATAKQAIVDKTFRQDSWYWGTSGNPDYQGKYNGGAYQVSLANASYRNEITRHAYAISVQDVLDYLEVTPQMSQADTTLTYDNVWTMFWNSTTSHSGDIWLRSAYASSDSVAFFVLGSNGSMTTRNARVSFTVRPAFQIDLSKIDYTFADGRQAVELKPVSVLQKSNNTLSRVGMSYKVPIDLTGTTWLFNNRIDVSPDAYYDINFVTNNEQFARISTNGVQLRYIVVGVTAHVAYQSNTWQSEAYRTIQITGGTDATNQDLVAWLQANATQQ